MQLEFGPLKLLQSLFGFILLLENVLPELSLSYVHLLHLLGVVLLNPVQRLLIEA